ncbi:MAG TPA: aminoacyl-tRNA hydrolase [Candidatus Acidoferrales bacterium]|jgi:PTH1 family peptidyl-tRNA hydrolase|nr:aminoacyl-tRNA hydrolase [Candidatus Acidoferrales bacterium]
MRLIAGLGNVGSEYEWTPHNAGFWAIDALAERHAIRVSRPEAKALIGRGTIAGHDVILAKPQTMMNLSGVAVRMLLEKYECEPSETIVLIDEIDLPWGMLRIRDRGRNSTHNGLKSIIATLGTDEFIRVRMGVQPERVWGDRKDYLLCTMGRDERQIAQQMAVEAAGAVEAVLTEGLTKAMNRFNRKVSNEEEERQ